MGNTQGIFATTCIQCSKVYIYFRNYTAEHWLYFNLKRRELLYAHECPNGRNQIENFTPPKGILVRNPSEIRRYDYFDQKIDFAIAYIRFKYPDHAFDTNWQSRYNHHNWRISHFNKIEMEIAENIEDILQEMDNSDDSIEEQIASFEKNLVLGVIKRNCNVTYK